MPDCSAHAHTKTQNHNCFKVWRKYSARAPDKVRDLGGSPGGCNGPGRVRKGLVLEQAGCGIGRPDYHDHTAAAIIEMGVFIDGAMLLVRTRVELGRGCAAPMRKWHIGYWGFRIGVQCACMELDIQDK